VRVIAAEVTNPGTWVVGELVGFSNVGLWAGLGEDLPWVGLVFAGAEFSLEPCSVLVMLFHPVAAKQNELSESESHSYVYNGKSTKNWVQW
jgi:hypothetical protein